MYDRRGRHLPQRGFRFLQALDRYRRRNLGRSQQPSRPHRTDDVLWRSGFAVRRCGCLADYASILTKEPATPEALRSDVPELVFAARSAATPAARAGLKVVLLDLLELLVAFDDDAVDEELGEPAVREKFWLPVPK